MTEVTYESVSEAEDFFNFLMKVQDKFTPHVVSEREAEMGEGRKGVLMIHGDNKWTKIFIVKDGRLVPAEGVDNARTVIVFEGLASFRKVCQELLAGSPSTFSRARARGEVKVVGEYALRDAAIFNRLLSKVGQMLSSYNVKFGD